jgi:hypothetical protein
MESNLVWSQVSLLQLFTTISSLRYDSSTGRLVVMANNPFVLPSDDPIIERAASDFMVRAARQDRPHRRGMSLRIGNLVIAFGVPLTVAYYEVFKDQSGDEDVRVVEDPSEADIARLCGD